MENIIYLVTGATGYTGGYLIKLLLAEGVKVRAFVRDRQKAQKLIDQGVEIAEGNLQDQDSIRNAVQGVWGVYHVGAVYREAKHPEEYYFDVNAQGTKRVFEESINAGVTRIIHCSTGGVMGDITNPPGNDKTPYNPGDVYQRSKVEAEKIALDFYRSKKIQGVVIRPAMVYGPEDTRHLKMFKMIAHNKFFYVGDGLRDVHFINILDLVRAFKLAMDHHELNGEIYSIAGERPLKLKQAVETIAENFGVKNPWLHIPVKPMQLAGSLCEAVCKPLGVEPPLYKRRVDFFTKNRNFDTSKAKRELGFEPSMKVEDELAFVAKWYREHGWV